MVPVKLVRLSLLEITQVTVRCQKCGFGVIADLQDGKLAMTRCPSCGTAFGEDVEDVFYRPATRSSRPKLAARSSAWSSTSWKTRANESLSGIVLSVAARGGKSFSHAPVPPG